MGSGSTDGTVRIWDLVTERTRANLTSIGAVSACAWLEVNTLAVGKQAGVYLFDFLAYTSPAAAGY